MPGIVRLVQLDGTLPSLPLMDILRVSEKLVSIRATTYNRLSICFEKFCLTVRAKLTWFSNNQQESFLTAAVTAPPGRRT